MVFFYLMTFVTPAINHIGREQHFRELIDGVSALLDKPGLLARLEPLGVDFSSINSSVFMPSIKGGIASLPFSADPNGVALLPLRKDEAGSGLYFGDDLMLPTVNRVAKMLAQAHNYNPEGYEELIDDFEHTAISSIRMSETFTGSPIARMRTAIGHCLSYYFRQSPGVDVTTRPIIMIKSTDNISSVEAAMVTLHEYVHADDSENRSMSDPDEEIDDNKHRGFTELRAYFASEVTLDYLGTLNSPNAIKVRAMKEVREDLFDGALPETATEITPEQLKIILGRLKQRL